MGTSPVQFFEVGALKVATPSVPLAYPSELIPSSAPSAPYQIAASEANGGYHPNPRVNPALQYVVTICNTTSSVHTVSSVTVNITGFSPSSGAVDEWNPCDGPYNTTTKTAGGGCGGGIGGPGFAFYSAALPNDAVGATATPQPTNGPPTVPIPFSLEPNTSLSLVVNLSGVTSQGTYTLAFDISVDSAAATTLAPSAGSFLIAPAAVKWTGQDCETPTMQAQIPASSQATYYVCPPSS